MPHSTSPGGTSFFSLGTPVILSLALGGAAIFVTGRLLKVAGLRATVAAQRVCLTAVLSKRGSLRHLASLAETRELSFWYFSKNGFHYVAQDGFELLSSGVLRTSASKSAGITAVIHMPSPGRVLIEWKEGMTLN